MLRARLSRAIRLNEQWICFWIFCPVVTKQNGAAHWTAPFETVNQNGCSIGLAEHQQIAAHHLSDIALVALLVIILAGF